MRQCACPGILAALSERFHQRLLEWTHTTRSSERTNGATVNAKCPACGAQWTMRFFRQKAEPCLR